MTGDNLRGSLLMIAAMALFAIEDGFIKQASTGLPVGLIVFVLGFCGAPLFAILARLQGARTLTRTALHPAVLLRNLGEMIGTMGFIIALAALPLAQVLSIFQSMPLLVTMGAALFLGETVGWRRWSAIAVGLIGVLIVIRPGMDGFSMATLWIIVAVLGMTLRDLVARKIPREITNAQVSTWGLWSVALLGAGMMAVSGGVHMPTGGQAALLLGGILFGSAGYWAMTTASRIGAVAVVTPFRYVRLVFAMLMGLLVFAEYPDIPTLIGAGIIVLSGLYSFARERTLSKRQALG
jgi:drug/metabolite transporter (DMT)-like permease